MVFSHQQQACHNPRGAMTSRARRIAACGLMLVGAMLSAAAAQAEPTAAEQHALFAQMVQNPTDYDATFAYVKVARERGDIEAAIGALERLLMYEPKLTRVKYELGALYFRLGAYEMAKRYFNEALAAPDVDAITRERIATYLPDAEKQTSQSRFSGFAQAGVRWQNNANYAPSSGMVRLGGQEYALLPSSRRRSDGNVFGIIGLSHDYDFDNQRGDVFETRFIGYGTRQFRFNDLDVGMVDINLGPRLMLLPDGYPGASVRPYVVAGKTWLDGASYLSSAGAGISLQLPVGDRLVLGPEFEWRRVSFSTGDVIPVSAFNSGNWYTGGLSAGVKIAQHIKLDARGLHRRGDSAFAFQAFRQWVGEAALTFEFDPPMEMMSRMWSLAPFVRVIRTEFDAANPFIDPLTIRRDTEWMTGLTLNAPIRRNFGVSATLQYNQVNSTLSNFSQNNFSVLIGPMARF